jgi:hypothetical protein
LATFTYKQLSFKETHKQLINVSYECRLGDYMSSRFRAGGNEQTAKLLEDIIYPEEVTHCAACVRWFRYLCLRPCIDDPISYSVPQSEPQSPGLPGDGTADEKTVREVRNEPTSVQQVEDEVTSEVSQDFNRRDNRTQQVEDGLAKCKLGDGVDKDMKQQSFRFSIGLLV